MAGDPPSAADSLFVIIDHCSRSLSRPYGYYKEPIHGQVGHYASSSAWAAQSRPRTHNRSGLGSSTILAWCPSEL